MSGYGGGGRDRRTPRPQPRRLQHQSDQRRMSTARRGRLRRTLAVATTVVVMGAVIGVVVATTGGSGGHHAAPVAATPTPSDSRTPSEQARDAARDLQDMAAHDSHLGVAAVNLSTGATVEAGQDRHFFTASIVKVDIATTLLRQLEARHETPSDSQRELLTNMIEISDDDSATDLWDEIGGTSALAATDRELGLDATTAGSGSYWGLTSTTAADQLTLLRHVLDGDALDHTDRDYLLHLMEHVDADQQWGLGAAAGSGDTLAVKDGWLPHEADHDRWITNSIGRIVTPQGTLLVAVLSNSHDTMPEGVHLDDHLAQLAAAAVT